MDKFDGKAKMYLQEDNGGFGLLITDGFGHWFYWGENELSVKLTNNAVSNVTILCKAIQSGEMYSAKEFTDECLDFEIFLKHYVPEYRKAVSLDDIALIEKNKCNYDFVLWYTVWKEV